MYCSFALFILSAIAVMAAPVPDYDVKDIPEQYRGLIPQSVLDFASGLSDEDKAILKEVAKDYKSYKNEDEALAALKAKSESLGAKAEELHKALKEKIDALGDDAKAFAKAIIKEGRELHAEFLAGNKPSLDDLKGKALAYFDKYHALSDDAKADLEKNFPLTAGLFKNEQVQALIKQHLKKD